MARIANFTFNGFQENTLILYDDSGECVVVDPGCSTPAEEQELTDFVEDNDLNPVRLLNTHCHIDHIMGNAYLSKQWGLPLEAHRKEEPILAAGAQLAQAYALPYRPSPSIQKFLEEYDVISFGNTTMQVLFVPGHSPGHIAFYNEPEKWIIGGDVLFRGSIGRYDLPGGDLETLMDSILGKMLTLPDEVTVYTGHGPSTTIGEERRTNPFILQYAAQ